MSKWASELRRKVSPYSGGPSAEVSALEGWCRTLLSLGSDFKRHPPPKDRACRNRNRIYRRQAPDVGADQIE